MRLVVDANVLMQILKVGGRNDLTCPRTGKIVDNPEGRAETLLDLMATKADRILIPTPALSEILVRVEDHDLHREYLTLINSMACFDLISFDAISAINCAQLVNNSELKQLKGVEDDKKKISFDRQIIAMTQAHGGDELWTHDKKMLMKAEAVGIAVKSLADVASNMSQLELKEESSPGEVVSMDSRRNK
ncbi:hypothetical protein [Vreelandella sp.]|uniref:hypothetical protein n=1 Tax=Vreelandella sp. TaxID=3137778 RepID=UPI003BA85D78